MNRETKCHATQPKQWITFGVTTQWRVPTHLIKKNKKCDNHGAQRHALILIAHTLLLLGTISTLIHYHKSLPKEKKMESYLSSKKKQLWCHLKTLLVLQFSPSLKGNSNIDLVFHSVSISLFFTVHSSVMYWSAFCNGPMSACLPSC